MYDSARTSSEIGAALKDDTRRINQARTNASAHDVEHQQSTQGPQDEPPDGGYGWVCVACCFWINAHTWGINSVGRGIHLGWCWKTDSRRRTGSS